AAQRVLAQKLVEWGLLGDLPVEIQVLRGPSERRSNLSHRSNRDGFAPNGPGRVRSPGSQRPLVVAASS
ncbi:hypothetical protein AB0D13_25270, partial [Streptomyces sp. NPDC048430]|uniref:hypothetical protein n=1 Tax=Streptomyces sp. NPDC048430 TaxID=3155388 RepID=UPI0034247087